MDACLADSDALNRQDFGKTTRFLGRGETKTFYHYGCSHLLLDYLLTVTVGISAGVGAVVSAIPSLHSHRLGLCLLVLVTLAFVNLRGIRESGLTFVVPVFMFVGCIAGTLLIGLFRSWSSGGNP